MNRTLRCGARLPVTERRGSARGLPGPRWAEARGKGMLGLRPGRLPFFFFPISNFFSVLFYSLFFSKPFSKRILRTIKYKPNTITTK
jgi:hypothetical protein